MKTFIITTLLIADWLWCLMEKFHQSKKSYCVLVYETHFIWELESRESNSTVSQVTSQVN